MKYTGFLLVIVLALTGCYPGECFRCRKFAPDPSGEGTYFTGTHKICPENDNIYAAGSGAGRFNRFMGM